jgi:hypothetical protein
VKFVRVIEETENTKRALFHHIFNGCYYLYSYVNRPSTHETAIFACDSNGEVTDWADLYMASGYVPSSDALRAFMNSDKFSDIRQSC